MLRVIGRGADMYSIADIIIPMCFCKRMTNDGTGTRFPQ